MLVLAFAFSLADSTYNYPSSYIRLGDRHHKPLSKQDGLFMYYQQPDGVSVHDGFPNPAADASLQTLDLNKLLIKHPISTFFMQDSTGRIFIIDRALTPRHNDLVVWTRSDKLVITPKHRVEEGSELWGVVTATIARHRSKS